MVKKYKKSNFGKMLFLKCIFLHEFFDEKSYKLNYLQNGRSGV